MKACGNTDLYATCTTHTTSGHLQSRSTRKCCVYVICTSCNISIERSGRDDYLFEVNLLKMLFLSLFFFDCVMHFSTELWTYPWHQGTFCSFFHLYIYIVHHEQSGNAYCLNSGCSCLTSPKFPLVGSAIVQIIPVKGLRLPHSFCSLHDVCESECL